LRSVRAFRSEDPVETLPALTAPHLPDFFFHLFHAAELDARGAPRFGAPCRRALLVGQLVQVGVQLVVEIPLDTGPRGDCARSWRGGSVHRHNPKLHSACLQRARHGQRDGFPLPVSLFNCRRPAAVSR
jgi:hypothetical protein